MKTKKKIKNSDILSPTFNIVYDYDVGGVKILHYDLYRIKNNEDISQLGIFETSKNYIKIVEWPELIENKPNDRIELFFEYSNNMNKRIINIKGQGKWKDYEFEKK